MAHFSEILSLYLKQCKVIGDLKKHHDWVDKNHGWYMSARLSFTGGILKPALVP